LRPGRGDGADDLVTRHKRVSGQLPVVVEHREVAVADAAGLHRDLDLLGAEGAEVDIAFGEFAAGFGGDHGGGFHEEAPGAARPR